MSVNQAIDTYYNGTLYRSKNEAKWSRFFTVGNIGLYYEPVTVTGFRGDRYKPDFYFPDYNKFAEVKSNRMGIQNDTMANKLESCIDYKTTDVSNGLLLLGTFPYDIRSKNIALKTKWLFWYKGVCCADAYIIEDAWGKIEIRFTQENFDWGAPLPVTASPEITVLPVASSSGKIMEIINETNDYFSEIAKASAMACEDYEVPF